MVQTSVKNYNA